MELTPNCSLGKSKKLTTKGISNKEEKSQHMAVHPRVFPTREDKNRAWRERDRTPPEHPNGKQVWSISCLFKLNTETSDPGFTTFDVGSKRQPSDDGTVGPKRGQTCY